LLFVYVIVVLPAATPVTTPLDTVAIEVLLEAQGVVAFAVPEPVNVTSSPIHTETAVDGLIVGGANTVTVTWSLTPPFVYVTVGVVPPLVEVNTAVDEVVVDEVVAILPALVLQVPPAGVAVNVKLPSSHTSNVVDVIDGAALTVKVAVA
jgi:hypothetical protein